MTQDYAALMARGQLTVAGTARASWMSSLLGDVGRMHISNVAVSPSAQRLGVGTALLRHAEEQASTLGLGDPRPYTNAARHENLECYLRLG